MDEVTLCLFHCMSGPTDRGTLFYRALEHYLIGGASVASLNNCESPPRCIRDWHVVHNMNREHLPRRSSED